MTSPPDTNGEEGFANAIEHLILVSDQLSARIRATRAGACAW
jgi:hypothetical protein